MPVAFNESFVGGFFGFRRTYGAVARIETGAAKTFESDWREALREVRLWRERRGPKAVSIDFFFVVPEPLVDDAREFLVETLIAPRDLPKDLSGLSVAAVVFDPDGAVWFEAALRPRSRRRTPPRG